MLIDCISDLHGSFPELPGGDLLIIAGDLTSNDTTMAWKNLFDWVEKQNYRKIVYIAGNHDGFLQQCCNSSESMDLWREFQDDDLKPNDRIEYLCDSSIEFEGLKIYGSPWTPEFGNWHFMLPRGEALRRKWDLIPLDTDILITHGPPWGILDKTVQFPSSNLDHCGCSDLKEAVKRIKPKLHVFGHIHFSYGEDADQWGLDGPITKYVNASHMNEEYEPVNPPIRIEL